MQTYTQSQANYSLKHILHLILSRYYSDGIYKKCLHNCLFGIIAERSHMINIKEVLTKEWLTKLKHKKIYRKAIENHDCERMK